MTAAERTPEPPPPDRTFRMYTVQAAPPVQATSNSASRPYDAQQKTMSRGLPITSLLGPDTSAPATTPSTTPVEKFQENGRTYWRHGSNMYMFPADDVEHERLDIIHQLIYGAALNNQLHIATFRSPPRRVLDVGFGTGFWVIDMCTKYPSAEIIGIDIDHPPRQHQEQNCSFRTPVDFNAPNWDIEDCTVDLVHMAQLCGCVPDWTDLYRKAYKSLRPGTGHVEHIEFDWMPRVSDNTQFPPQAYDIGNWWSWTLQASERAGKSLRYREDTEDLLESAGFVDITHKRVKVPLFNLGTKDKREQRLAHAYQTAMGYRNSQSFTGFSMALFTRYWQMPPHHVEEYCARALAVVQENHTLPLFITLHVWTARRPQG